MKLYLFFTSLFFPLYLFSQTAPDHYWIQFTDKESSPYSLSTPGDFLSEKALARRDSQGITLRRSDLPVNPRYIDSIKKYSKRIRYRSKWLNAVTIEIKDSSNLAKIKELPFVKQLRKTESNTSGPKHLQKHFLTTSTRALEYGRSFRQINMLNGHLLHREGYRGEGKVIAVVDAGFHKANKLIPLQHLWKNNRILATRDYVDGGKVDYTHSIHGRMVLSVLTGQMRGKFVGSAPDATFMLLRSEKVSWEFPTEEDAWIAAVEYADSLGADIITSSLGYSTFDSAQMNHSYSSMDGKTTRISRAATIAARKGMLVVNAAGNEGVHPWHFIVAPADADSILAVGAVDSTASFVPFSSRGPSYDGRIKPEVAAMGLGVYLISAKGKVVRSNGTSFATPLISGMASCLWSAFPNATNMEIRNAIIRSGSRYHNPDSLTGYGIPDLFKAFTILNNELKNRLHYNQLIAAYPNPFQHQLNLAFFSGQKQKMTVSLKNTGGRILWSDQLNSTGKGIQNLTIPGLGFLPKGVYILSISTPRTIHNRKIVKY